MAVKTTKSARPKMSLAGLKRSWAYLGHYPRIMVVAYGSLIIATLAQLVVPSIVRNIIDTITNGVISQKVIAAPAAFQSQIENSLGLSHQQVLDNSTNAVSKLIWAALAIVGFAIVKGIFTFLQNYNAERLSQSVAYDFRNDLFAKIQRLSFSYHDRNQTGQLMIRATDDVEKVRLFLGQGLLMTLSAIVLLVGALIILFTTNLALTLVVLPILPVAMVVFFIFGAISQPLFFKVQQKLSGLNTILQENLAGIKVVKAFAREPDQEAKFTRATDELVAQQIKISRVFGFLFPLIFLIANLGQTIVLFAGGSQIINKTLTLGEWQQFSLYLAFIFFPLAQLGMIITQMSQAAASANRIFEILDAKSDVVDEPGAQPIAAIDGHVEFKNVGFSYPGSTTPVLSGVSFVARPGQTIALLGETGSGKTTIINLVPRFYDPTQGQVLVDGHDLRDLTIDSLRKQIGIVLQETNLFTGTIRDNIAFGRSNATQEQVEAAARAASAHDFILQFPQGYDTSVGELGSTLSGGRTY